MITLKDYQSRVLDSLRDFFRMAARDQSPEGAFRTITERNTGQAAPYISAGVAGLAPRMPYVCLRVPTGGGKTLLACHAVGLAMTEFLRADRAVALWLVPSTAILQQTADALRDPRHPYRRALEVACGAVEVFTIEEALRLSRASVDGQTVVIVSTIQAFRVEDTTGRKVYEQNGSFAEHLLNVPSDRLAELLPGADGKPKPSLVNMLRLRRPIVIVDEAHNARTDLSFSTLGQVAPSCIVEFTATPARGGAAPSNILHRVSAAELKAAEMVKLPLRVVTRHPSQKDQLLGEAIWARAGLEALANKEGQMTREYLRPILLIQAERVDACEPLRARLTAEFNLPKEHIKISVGSNDELPTAEEIKSPKEPAVRVIITVQKLREGWDCPFAYVLCSLKETRSATAIEQIVGRILRLPNAKSKENAALNCAYAFSVSDSLPEVLQELREALENNGFTKAEADRIIIPVEQDTLPLGLQPEIIQLPPGEIDAEAASAQRVALSGKVRIDAEKGTITVLVPLSAPEEERLAGCVKSFVTKGKIAAAVKIVREREKAFGGTGAARDLSPFERQLDFIVPLLSVREEGMLLEFESTFLLEHPWKLSMKDASLPPDYNPLQRPVGRAGTLDVGTKGEVQAAILQEEAEGDFVGRLHQQMLALGAPADWTMERLVGWLDRQIDHRDIPVGESAEFLRQAVQGLMTKHGINDIGLIALDRFRLREAIEYRIQEHRQSERKVAFQGFLSLGSDLAVSEERAINFRNMPYDPLSFYGGAFQFRKHYFKKIGNLDERKPNGGLREEFKCAQFLDGLPEVKFWIRNLPNRPGSFRLQTSGDRFYPDFVCELVDGRKLVVEYKGPHLYAGAEEKRAVGQVWQDRSAGRCIFVMPEGFDLEKIRAAIKT